MIMSKNFLKGFTKRSFLGKDSVKIKDIKMKCFKCTYEWEPRVEAPKECPECKTRLSKLNGE
jgi:predicted Zn-ribbon and HTH transcriptional regulator